jgi:hypothetical protein
MYNEMNSNLKSYKRKLDELNTKLENTKSEEISEFQKTIDELLEKKDVSEEKLSSNKDKSLYYTELTKIFSPDGIRKSIILNIIKPINHFIAENLSVMGVPFTVVLDENFNAEIKQFGEQEIWELKLSKGKSKKTIHTTENHRWFRRAYRKGNERNDSGNKEVITKDLNVGDKLVSTFGQSIKNITPSSYGIISGIVFGDGSVCNNIAQVRLCGEKDAQLLKYFLNPKTYPYENDIIVAGLPKYFKERPSLDMDKGYLYGWLAGYFAADGSVKKSGQIRLSSANRDNLLFVRDVLVKLGIAYSPIILQKRVGIGQTVESDLYSININGVRSLNPGGGPFEGDRCGPLDPSQTEKEADIQFRGATT